MTIMNTIKMAVLWSLRISTLNCILDYHTNCPLWVCLSVRLCAVSHPASYPMVSSCCMSSCCLGDRTVGVDECTEVTKGMSGLLQSTCNVLLTRGISLLSTQHSCMKLRKAWTNYTHIYTHTQTPHTCTTTHSPTPRPPSPPHTLALHSSDYLFSIY